MQNFLFSGACLLFCILGLVAVCAVSAVIIAPAVWWNRRQDRKQDLPGFPVELTQDDDDDDEAQDR